MHLTDFVLSHILTWVISNILYITLALEEVTYWKEKLAFTGNLQNLLFLPNY